MLCLDSSGALGSIIRCAVIPCTWLYLVGHNIDLLQVQDILLYHNLALAVSRTYVYQPFVWRPRGEKSYVPLSAFLVGATKGSISSKVFHRICPENDVVHLSLSTGSAIQWQHALEMLAGDERCVMIDDWIFNWTYVNFFFDPLT